MDQVADWAKIGQQLAAPFPPEVVEWRVQDRPEAGKRQQAVVSFDQERRGLVFAKVVKRRPFAREHAQWMVALETRLARGTTE